MLCTSELAEALEADRKEKYADLEMFASLSKLSEKVAFEDHVKDTIEDELADTIIRILDICKAKNIDIGKHVELKMKYNAGQEMLHGKKY